MKSNDKICICFASDDSYFPYCWNTICSVLAHRGEEFYEFIVLEKDISKAHKNSAKMQIEKLSNTSIRFIDTTPYAISLPKMVRAYYSVVTYYRALLFSDVFSAYDKILYLDSDIVVRKDLAELYFKDISAFAGAVVKDYTMDAKMLFHVPIAYQGTNYNALSYVTKSLNIADFIRISMQE